MDQNNINDLHKLLEDLYDANGIYWKFTQYIEFQERIIQGLCESFKDICHAGNDTSLTIEEFFNKLTKIIEETKLIASNYSSMRDIFEKEIKKCYHNQ